MKPCHCEAVSRFPQSPVKKAKSDWTWDIVQNAEKQQLAAQKSVTVQSEIRHTRQPANSTWEGVEENRHVLFRFYAFRETSKRAIDLTCSEISHNTNTIQLTTCENEGRSYHGIQESSCVNPIRTNRELVIHPHPSRSLASLTPDTDTLVPNDPRIYLFHINQKFNKNNPTNMAIPDMNHEGCMYKSHNPRKHLWYSSFQATALCLGELNLKGGGKCSK